MKTNLMLATALMSAAFVQPALSQNPAATAIMMDTSGNALGTLTLMETDDGVQITGSLAGIPNGEHGFHIHETGTCDGEAGFESAGAHFNPEGREHGLDNPDGPHAGDMVNIVADVEGNAPVEVTNTMVTLTSGPANSLDDADGSALMLHLDHDDHMTDPGGDAGERFACGVIEFAQ